MGRSRRSKPKPVAKRAGRRRASKRTDRPSECTVCGDLVPRLQVHMKVAHFPYFLFPFTACWLCGIQFGRPTVLRSHLKDAHNSEGSPFQEQLAGVWAQQVTGYLYALSKILGFVSLDAMVSFGHAVGLLPREPLPDERRAMGLYASACASPSAGLPPGWVASLLCCHALGGIAVPAAGSCQGPVAWTAVSPLRVPRRAVHGGPLCSGLPLPPRPASQGE